MLNGNIDVGKMLRGAGVTLICALTLVQGYVVEINKSGCPLDQSIDRLLEHNNCNKFYQCVNGDLVEQTCPKDLLFNIEIQTCDKFENVFCDDRLIPENNGTDGGGAGGGGNNGTCNCNPEDAPFICGAADSDGVLVAHENCDQFYLCSNGTAVAKRCFGNQLYNPYIGRCDWPENVFCGDRLIPENNGTDGGGAGGGSNNGTCNCNPEDAPFICGAAGSNGVLVAHENCDQFYLCSNGTAVAKRCFGNQLYNPYIGRCDWPENVFCGDRLIPENNGTDGGGAGGGGNNGTCNCNPEDAPFICGAAGSDGVLVAHENCDQFYLCSNGTAVAKRCFGNQLYNPYIGRCDWPENVFCGDRLIPENNGTDGGGAGGGGNNGTCNCNPEDAPFICGAAGSDGVLVAHENCDQFYLCSNGTAVAKRCFGNHLYNPYIGRCDWPENVFCGDRLIPENNGTDGGGAGGGGNNGTCNCNPEDAPFICGAAGSNGVLVAHENCDQFYLCSNVTAVAKRCFGNHLYNPYIGRCDWPENVFCGDRLIPENNGTDGGGAGGGGNNGTCNCNPEDAPFICGAAGSNGVLVAHENCDQFYLCSNGTAVAKRCFGNQLYNPYIGRCDWPENVFCGDRLIPENNGTDGGGAGGGGNNGTCNCNPEDAPFICGAAGSDGVLVAHENCDQFYLCSNGTAVAKRCFGNQLYNPYIGRCDWPANVFCGDRLIPENNGTDDGGAGGGGNNGTCNCNPEDAPFICSAAGSDGSLVAHQNCDQFYLCSNGTAVAKRCFGNQLYNPYIGRCDWPENVFCGNRLIPENNGTDGGGAGGGGNNGTCNCNPEDAPFICGAAGSNGVLVAHENCDQFYLCSNGTAVAKRCFGNQLYNPYIGRCDWPENVFCGDRLIPENNGTDGGGAGGGGNNGTCNCNPEDAPFICGAAGSDGVLVAHENCDQFYLCSNGTAVAMRCFGNQLYNPYIERCDSFENVSCDSRIISDFNNKDRSEGQIGREVLRTHA